VAEEEIISIEFEWIGILLLIERSGSDVDSKADNGNEEDEDRCRERRIQIVTRLIDLLKLLHRSTRLRYEQRGEDENEDDECRTVRHSMASLFP
jgi:hypothetical protein